MSEQNIHIGHDAQGNAFGDQSKVINKNSFNTQSADLAALLKTMRQEFDKLSSADAEKVRPYVEAIESEAQREKPDKSFLAMTKNGMVEAAKTCAEMAPSLLTAAAAVADWFK